MSIKQKLSILLTHRQNSPACIICKSIKRDGKTLLEIRLETGRYHQIRAQLAAMGHPILGDEKYGSSLPWKRDQIALHHGKLKFTHPVTKETLCFESPISR